MKMNSLVDRRCIQALYEASQAGVRIDLNVRGICCARAGVPGVSENMRVISVVGRFLEHSRIYGFHRGEERRYYIGSPDLMPRNLDTRVELLVPVEDERLRAELEDTLERCLADDTFCWELQPDGSWERRARRQPLGPGRADAAAPWSASRPTPRAPSRAPEVEHAGGGLRHAGAEGTRPAGLREQAREDQLPRGRARHEHLVGSRRNRAHGGGRERGAPQDGVRLDAVGHDHAAEAQRPAAAGRAAARATARRCGGDRTPGRARARP